MLAMAAAGCKYFDGSDNDNLLLATKDEVPTAATFGSAPEKIWLDKAKENFRRGEYGLAERYFRQAIEERHSNVEAWLGLAASYDRLKRFDEADRAYKIVTAMVGNTATVLNNLGYHYMLKGEFANAEKSLREAQEKEPNNPYVRNNLILLSNWKSKAGVSG
ncbi:MAG: tetratricopeptide repeat protein [Rhodomicrobium sp.]